jgi:hypothetical protein
MTVRNSSVLFTAGFEISPKKLWHLFSGLSHYDIILSMQGVES